MPHQCQTCRNRGEECSGLTVCDVCSRESLECVYELGEKGVIAASRKGIHVTEDPRAYKQALLQSQPVITPSETHTDRLSLQELYKAHAESKDFWLLVRPNSTLPLVKRLLNAAGCNRDLEILYPALPGILNEEDDLKSHQNRVNCQRPPMYIVLPLKDRALSMATTVRLYLMHLYPFIEENTFPRHVDEFYHSAAMKHQTSPLWYLQFLVVLALAGELSVPRDKTTVEYFATAMGLLPPLRDLLHDPEEAISLLGLISVYFERIGLFDVAYLYVGDAIGIARLHGFSRSRPGGSVGNEVIDRRRRLWYTLYGFSMTLSALTASPTSVSQREISATESDVYLASEPEAGLSLQGRASRGVSEVLRVMYLSFDRYNNSPFVLPTADVGHQKDPFKNLAPVLDTFSGGMGHMVNVANVCFLGSKAFQDVVRRIKFRAYWSSMAISRALILKLLIECVHPTRGFRLPPVTYSTLLPAEKRIMRHGVEHAKDSLRIMQDVQSDNELGSMPFDAENTFSAALTLRLVAAFVPGAFHDPGNKCRDEAHRILEFMAVRGNLVAHRRKRELAIVEELLRVGLNPQFLAYTQNLSASSSSAGRPAPAPSGRYILPKPAPSSSFASSNPALYSNFAGQNPPPSSDSARQTPTPASNSATSNPALYSSYPRPDPALDSSITHQNPAPSSSLSHPIPDHTSSFAPPFGSFTHHNPGLSSSSSTHPTLRPTPALQPGPTATPDATPAVSVGDVEMRDVFQEYMQRNSGRKHPFDPSNNR
ncbi:hypothetical protein BDW62DRAFT_202755 [Aspergillus aurantiobrunneus]